MCYTSAKTKENINEFLNQFDKQIDKKRINIDESELKSKIDFRCNKSLASEVVTKDNVRKGQTAITLLFFNLSENEV